MGDGAPHFIDRFRKAGYSINGEFSADSVLDFNFSR